MPCRLLRNALLTRRPRAGLAGLVLALGTVGTVAAQSATPVALAPGQMTAVRPCIVPVGDDRMAGVPDGLGARLDGDRVVVLMNHGLSAADGSLSGSRVSRLVLDPKTGAVLAGRSVVDGTEGDESFCSAFLADGRVGFGSPTFLTGEESTASTWGGMAVAVDGDTGKATRLPWLGFLDHENVLVVPGFAGKTVVLLTDDDSEGSELCQCVADGPADLLAGKGQLSVFVADGATGTADVAKGASLAGHFAPIDQKDNADAAGAFTFVRLEDLTSDRANPATVSFADTGDSEAPNLAPDGTPLTKNGRIHTLTLDAADPAPASGFGVLFDGDKGDASLNPDNPETDGKQLMIQEDRNGHNRTEFEDTAPILSHDLASKSLTPVARLDQSECNTLTDPGVKAGEWGSSGIIDASNVLGPGAWLIDVQAHPLKVPQFGGGDEGGHLLLVRSKQPNPPRSGTAPAPSRSGAVLSPR